MANVRNLPGKVVLEKGQGHFFIVNSKDERDYLLFGQLITWWDTT